MRLEGIADGRFALAGRLPAGASRAIVVLPSGEKVEAACDGGEFRVVFEMVDAGPPPVRFEDDAGAIVRPRLPESWAREPVDDATEPCPACGAVEWELVTPGDHSRGSVQQGDGPLEPASVVVCRRCGHEEDVGAWTSYAGALDDAATARYVEARRREQRDVVARIDFPAYALAGEPDPWEIAGWGSDGRRTTAVTISHRDVRIESEPAPYEGPTERMRGLLYSELQEAGEAWPEASRGAIVVWLRARERERQAAVTRATPLAVDVAVDGVPVRFEGLRSGSAWGLVGDVGGVRVSISAAGGEPGEVRLRRIDPSVNPET
jgi:hypothetical protein